MEFVKQPIADMLSCRIMRLATMVLMIVGVVESVYASGIITQDLQLNPGWNAVYLEVNPDDENPSTNDDRTPANVFDAPEIAMVWTLMNPEDPAQFTVSPSEIGFNDASWRVYIPSSKPEAMLTNLYAATPGRVYLVKVEGNSAINLSIQGRPHFKEIKWPTKGYQLVGLYADPQTPTTFSDFLDTTSNDVLIYQLNNSTAEWETVSLHSYVESGRGYWIYNDGSLIQTAPIDIGKAVRHGIVFPGEISVRNFPFINRTGGTDSTITFQVTSGFPLQYFAGYGATTSIPEWQSIDAQQFTLDPGKETSMLVGVDRTNITQTTESVLTVTGLGARIRIGLQAEPLLSNAGLWAGLVILDQVTHIHSTAADKLEVAPSPLQFKLLLHVDDAGTVNLLKQVYIVGEGPDNNPVLVTNDGDLSAYSGIALSRRDSVGYRLSSSAFDFVGDTLTMSGDLSSSLSGLITLNPDHATHPMKHKYHTNHDDLDNYTGSQINSSDTFYDEVWQITRSLSLTTDQLFSPSASDGMGRLVGTYQETISGLHKEDVVMKGRFELQRISKTGTLE